MGGETWMVHTCSKVFLALLFVYPPCHIVHCSASYSQQSHCQANTSNISASNCHGPFCIIVCQPTPVGHLMPSQSFKLARYMSLPSSPHQSKSISLACSKPPTSLQPECWL